MPTLLHIDSSPMAETSISRRLTREFVQAWRRSNASGEVVYRDIAKMEIPVIDAAWVDANYTPKASRTHEQNSLLALSTTLARELQDADEYVIGVPMHNWGPSSSFKLWADQIVHFGETVLITPSGMKGNLKNKRATFIIATGRKFSPGSTDADREHLTPWLRTFFGNLGITNMRFVRVDGTAAVNYGNIDRESFLAPYIEEIDSL